MHIIIAGGTGFIGTALKKRLKAEGHQVTILSRHPGEGTITWDDPLPDCDAIINLCGASIFKPWTPEYKRELFASRLDPTRKLIKAIKNNPPKVLINASATGCYSQDMSTEESPLGYDFLASLCYQWESVAKLPEGHPTRIVIIRIGLALSPEGGALKNMLTPFKWGLGGKIGSGAQGFPWIHIDDLLSLFLFAIDNPVTGILNGVAPQTVTNAEFTHTLGKVLHRPTLLPIPALLLKFLLRERAAILLNSVRAVPARPIQLGFEFQYPELTPALKNLIDKSRSR